MATLEVSLDTALAGLGCIALGAFWLGVWCEAMQWRSRAITGFRRESGGKLYNVTLDRGDEREARPTE